MMGFARSLTHRPRADFAAAGISRLTADWVLSYQSADGEIRSSLTALRARARELVRNTSWIRRYIHLMAQNVVGPKGIRLQARLKQSTAGTALETANQRIEDAWAEWGQVGTCTVDGKLSWLDLQRLVMKNLPSDGEVLIRIVRGFDNPFGFALQMLDPDQLDDRFNVPRNADGVEIRMGVEFDVWNRPLAYHVFDSHPANLMGRGTRKRIPAADIILLGEPDRPAQTRYVPWIASVMLDINMLRGYFEAELVAARVAAAQGGFFTRKESDIGDNVTEGGSDQALKFEMEPGTWTELPAGLEATPFTPEHPTSAFPNFVKAVLRSVSTGLGISYNALANDLEGVNYSSIRAGMLDERDSYRVIQQSLIEHMHQRVYNEWVPWALLAGRLDARVPMDRYRQITWQPRGWAWVDPQADIEAGIRGVQTGLNSRKRLLAEQGMEFEEVVDDLKDEREILQRAGLWGIPEQTGELVVTESDQPGIGKNRQRLSRTTAEPTDPNAGNNVRLLEVAR